MVCIVIFKEIIFSLLKYDLTLIIGCESEETNNIQSIKSIKPKVEKTTRINLVFVSVWMFFGVSLCFQMFGTLVSLQLLSFALLQLVALIHFHQRRGRYLRRYSDAQVKRELWSLSSQESDYIITVEYYLEFIWHKWNVPGFFFLLLYL
ncbi:hypothetical protein VIGAN_02169900 [Vigna angularis var. angularis]|uniref:Uncharacterized protein n=1 Tax=Vigna angularis var. angularis TaxID=157739 RepID=A0A0S3RE85_PHAAN|nr:hypothetical protein VIGAN_02169900 [Vigna angularis var. angularis]